MDTKNVFGYGFISIGQCGGKILDAGFSKDYPVFAINTALVDLQGLKRIPKDCQYLASITDGGGAGKNISVGELAIVQHKDEIVKRISTLFKIIKFLWLVAGLGGGRGTLGLIQMVQILTELSIPHGIIATVPLNHDGTLEKSNCAIGLHQIYLASKQSNYLQTTIFINNNDLKQKVMAAGNFTYENFWELANMEVYSQFEEIHSFANRASETCMDIEDTKVVATKQKGCLFFNKVELDLTGNSENGLALSMLEMLKDTIYITGDILKGTAVGVVIERPKDFDTDGLMIDRLFDEIKVKFGAGAICKGVYPSSLTLKETLGIKKKPVTIYLIVSGIPFPLDYLKALGEESRNEIKDLKAKETVTEDLGADFDFIKDFLRESSDPKPAQKIDLSVFYGKQEATWTAQWEEGAAAENEKILS